MEVLVSIGLPKCPCWHQLSDSSGRDNISSNFFTRWRRIFECKRHRRREAHKGGPYCCHLVDCSRTADQEVVRYVKPLEVWIRESDLLDSVLYCIRTKAGVWAVQCGLTRCYSEGPLMSPYPWNADRIVSASTEVPSWNPDGMLTQSHSCSLNKNKKQKQIPPHFKN